MIQQSGFATYLEGMLVVVVSGALGLTMFVWLHRPLPEDNHISIQAKVSHRGEYLTSALTSLLT